MIRLFSLLFVSIIYSVDGSVNDRYYPRYHLAPPFGWMNDPNGFSIFNDEYHLFYQFNPNSSLEPGIAHWGHAKSTDLFNWQHLPIAMYPDQEYDKTGVFSGSALIQDDVMYLFYTGNVNFENQSPDHHQVQALTTSSDGLTFTKYDRNPIIAGDNLQPNIRDPKVWKHDDTYYMVLGNSYNNDTLGRTLLFASNDMINWEQVSILFESNGGSGVYSSYMHECPDFFEIDGRFVLLFSPQGIEPSGDNYKNLYQTGYIVGNFDYVTHKFTPISEFLELDHGHDFYATQTILDKNGNRIVIAWFDMWENDYPEMTDGFTGQMTIPRELRLTIDNRIIQTPVPDVNVARNELLREGVAKSGYSVVLTDNTGDIEVIATAFKDFELILETNNNTKVTITFDSKNGQVTLDRGDAEDIRRTSWRPQGLTLQWRVFVDASSIELFCGDGTVTFSSRFFPDGQVSARIGAGIAANMRVYSMKRTVIVPDNL